MLELVTNILPNIWRSRLIGRGALAYWAGVTSERVKQGSNPCPSTLLISELDFLVEVPVRCQAVTVWTLLRQRQHRLRILVVDRIVGDQLN